MELNRGRWAIDCRTAFDHVWVERALCQKLCAFDLGGFVGKAVYKSLSDSPPFFLWLGDSREHGQKFVLGRHNVQVGFEMRLKLINHSDRLIFSKQAVVDEDAGELIADGPAQERCDNG